MDPGKKRALINWVTVSETTEGMTWNAVSKKNIQSFANLRDGTIIANVLQTCGDNLIPNDTDLRSPQKCLSAIKWYIESFYHQPLDDGALINFELLLDKNVKEELLEMEVGKLLLAVLGCVIQDRGRENFITPALTMDESSQSEMRMLILSTICKDDGETKLQPGFHEVLKQKQEPSSHLDAAFFFQLVAEKGTTAVGTPGPQTPSASNGGSFVTMYTNSPGGATPSGLNIRDISSPMRLMSLSSPVTPLGALMSSPQLTQKAELRKKDYEFRKLEAALRNEQHLRSEVELDLKERSQIVEDKEMRIRELERQLTDVRQVRDKLDELEELQAANETLRKDITRLQNRQKESQDLREHNTVLQRENSEYMAELQKAREEMKVLDSIQRSSETYRAKCHKQQLEISELELALGHWKDEKGSLQRSYDELRNMYEIAGNQCKVLKAEKEELEELLGTRNAEMAGGGLCSLGESMNVVTEKKLAELQAQYESIRTSWIDPHQHTSIVKELAMEKETKKTYEERYFEVKKKLMSTEVQLEKMSADLQRTSAVVAQLEANLGEASEARTSLEATVASLRHREESMRHVEAELRAEKEQRDVSIEGLEKELSQCQAALELTQKELEAATETCEERRTAIMQMDQEREQKHQAEQKLVKDIEKLSKDLDMWKAKGEELQHSQEELVKLQMEKEDITKRLSEKVHTLEEEISKLNRTLKSEKKISEEKLLDVENMLKSETSEYEKQLREKERLQEEFDQFKVSADKKEQLLEEKLEAAVKDKRAVDLELHKLSLEFSNSTDSYSTKVEKMEVQHKENTDLLNNEIRSLKNTKEECLSVQGRLKEEIGKLNHTIQKQKEEIQKLNRLVENLKSANSELVDSLEQSKLTVAQYEYQLKTLKEKLEGEKVQSADMKKEKTDMINSLQRQLDGTLNQYSTEKMQLCQQMEKVEGELECSKKEFTDMKSHMETELSSARCEYEKQMNDIKVDREKDAENFKEKIQELTSSNEKVVESLKSTIGDFEQKLKNNENVRLELECAVKEKEALVSSMSEQLEYLKSVEKSLNNTIRFLETDYDTMKNLVGEKEKVKTELAESNAKKEEKIKQLEDGFVSLQENIETLQKEKAQLVEKHESNVSELSSNFTEQLNDLKSNFSGSELKAVQAQEAAVEEIARLTAVVDEKSAAVDQLTQEMKTSGEERDKVISEMRVNIEHFEGELKKSLEKSQTVEQEKQKLESQLNELRTAFENLKSEMSRSTVNAGNERCDLENKLSHEAGLRANLESQLSVLTEEQKVTCANLELMMKDKAILEETLEKNKEQFQNEMSELKDKLDETEHYWKSQCEDLAEEYEQGTNEQKEDMNQQLEELKSAYEDQMERLSDEKDLCIATQAQSYQERIHGLEKAIAEKKEDLTKQAEEMAALEERHNQTIAEVRTELTKQIDSQNYQQGESERLMSEVSDLKEETNKKVEMLIGQYETQLEEQSALLKTEHENNVRALEEQYKGQIGKLQTEVEEQRVNYQQMMCDMEEKLGGEACVLRERLSQMKCQYDTLIETKEKDTKAKVCDYETKVSEYESKVSDFEAKLNISNEEKAGFQQNIVVLNQEIAELKCDKEELLKKNAELEEVISAMKASQIELEGKVKSMQELLDGVQGEVEQVKDGARRALEELGKEKGEAEELRRQLEYSRDRNDTLTAELSSQQQQLAAVEDEKRVLEEEVSRQAGGHQRQLEDLAVQHDRRGLEVEELERQLQASHKCYEAVQKSQTELESQLNKASEDRANMETRNRELEQRIYNYLEREKKMCGDNQHQIDKAAELNGTLRRQLDEKCSELHRLNEEFNKKMECMTEDFSRTKKKFGKEQQTLREDKTALEIEAAQLKKVEEKLAASEAEAKRLQDITTQYNHHYNKKKETIATLEARLKSRDAELDEMRRTEEKLLAEITPVREKLDMERMKNGKLTSNLRTSEAQTDLMERKLREYKQALERGNAVYLGDSSEFQKLIQDRDSASDASFMENHPSSIPMNNSVFAFDKHEVEKHQPFYDDTETMSETLTPNTRSSRNRKRISKSVSSSTVISSEKDADTVSIGSASSLAYRLRSRESAVSLNRSYASVNSCKSNASVPRGTGGIFHCEDEPMEFEWGRLGELQRRNTLCPAHLKTSYPVETQTYKPTRFREEALRESTMGNKTILEQVTGSGRKRKQGWESDSAGSDDSDNKNKQAKTAGCVYHKPGPPTPANQRRNSGKGSRSPGSRSSRGSISKSPKTPYSLRSKKTPRRTPKHTPKRTGVVDNRENAGSAKKAGWRDSVSFQIGFSPQSSTGSSRHLRRQQGFVQKQPQSASQVSKLVNFFEKSSTPTNTPPLPPPRPTPSPSFRGFGSVVNKVETDGNKNKYNYGSHKNVGDEIFNNESKCSLNSRRRMSSQNEAFETPYILVTKSQRTQSSDLKTDVATTESNENCLRVDGALNNSNFSVKRHLTFERYPRAERVYDEPENIYDEINDLAPRISLSEDPANTKSEPLLCHPLPPPRQSTPMNSSNTNLNTTNSNRRDKSVRHLGDSPNFLRQFTSLGLKNKKSSKSKTSVVSKKSGVGSPTGLPSGLPPRRPFASSSTSRFRGTPIKLKMSGGLTPKDFKSCSALFSSPKVKKQKKRPLTPHKIHTGDTYTGDAMNTPGVDNVFNAFETVQRGTIEPDNVGSTPGRLTRWLSKIKTPSKGPKVAPFEDHF